MYKHYKKYKDLTCYKMIFPSAPTCVTARLHLQALSFAARASRHIHTQVCVSIHIRRGVPLPLLGCTTRWVIFFIKYIQHLYNMSVTHIIVDSKISSYIEIYDTYISFNWNIGPSAPRSAPSRPLGVPSTLPAPPRPLGPIAPPPCAGA